MRQKLLGAALFVAASMACSGAMAQEARWDGQLKLVSKTAPCAKVPSIDDFAGGSPAVRFRPKIRGGEENSALSFTFGHAASIIQTTSSTSQLNGQGSYKGSVISGRVEFYNSNGKYNFVVSPSSITSSTGKITIKGTIADFWEKGCTIGISATLTPR